MACDCPEPRDCCQDCPEPPAPVLPRCDFALTDGVFVNATVVIEDGCISSVATGRPPQYNPATCCNDDCGGGGGGGGGGGQPGPPGRPGADGDNAEIFIGQVFKVAADQPAKVVNVGSPTTAILDFYLPQGDTGDTGDSPNGVTDTTAGIDIVDGVIQSLPATWPPAMAFVTNVDDSAVDFDVTQPDGYTGMVTISLSLAQYTQEIHDWVMDRIEEITDPLDDRIATLESKVSQLETALNALTTRVNSCCP